MPTGATSLRSDGTQQTNNGGGAWWPRGFAHPSCPAEEERTGTETKRMETDGLYLCWLKSEPEKGNTKKGGRILERTDPSH